MKVSLVSSTLSYNPMIRVYPFATFLQERFDTQLIGPVDTPGIYAPLRAEPLNYAPVRERKIFPFYLQPCRDIYNRIDGEVIHAFKTKLYSFGISLLKRRRHGQKVILDIDDWDSQYVYDNYFGYAPHKLAPFLLADGYIPEGYFSKKLLEKISSRADAIIVDSFALQRMFGGTYIPPGADTDAFDPEKISGTAIRERYGIEKGDVLVSFLGNPRRHKGIPDLLRAFLLAKQECEQLKLLIVGVDDTHPAQAYRRYIQQLRKVKGVLLEGFRPHEEMPAYLAASDICPIPSRKSPSSAVQMPYKIFQAMARGK